MLAFPPLPTIQALRPSTTIKALPNHPLAQHHPSRRVGIWRCPPTPPNPIQHRSKVSRVIASKQRADSTLPMRAKGAPTRTMAS